MSFQYHLDELKSIADYFCSVPAEHVADLFSNAGSIKQAEILNHIATLFIGYGGGKGCLQNCSISENLSVEAVAWIKNLYEHATEAQEPTTPVAE